MEGPFAGWLPTDVCYDWGAVFALGPEHRVRAMSQQAAKRGLCQLVAGQTLIWRRGEVVEARFVFVDDPTNIEAIRGIYNDAAHAVPPGCYVVVRQPDTSDDRGEVIFDIFRLSPQSYLSHQNRVYTAPAGLERPGR
jgi:hypothetical protein